VLEAAAILALPAVLAVAAQALFITCKDSMFLVAAQVQLILAVVVAVVDQQERDLRAALA
jgi:hypothetical protein